MSNLYAYGRLAWNPADDAQDILQDWSDGVKYLAVQPKRQLDPVLQNVLGIVCRVPS
jgi:alpha-glucuronidase